MQFDLNPDQQVQHAAEWLAGGGKTGAATVPELRSRFGITAPQAIEAIRLANALRLARAH
ncbi:hypothetical protein LB516_24055 [Mesorhizobium sp. CO1-1-7]|uniref:hypothetical protein n=1 Tax=unclassified Mesorhizobium TaxID=325217 RepID=UPI00112E592F|nr:MULTISPECIES: hypothetical protein [unclassified Mesorhizobium]MBZ9748309.1 hypothetical protein [Mesorhizobium sp. CO1-1-7]MBZ9927749.1 hypothetical protein [Mesorhizobium sp. BR1-1-4]TPJ12908.1 hypothetical protein FJW04_21875 [Mesorhizobium sp. B2-7-3]TPL67543.1 hypothetical protein FJ954_24775 [Mesorhizobium sp. B2-3-15]TPL99404.1 hypothetical protein FJ943_13020 [Mesorhizobium sp. B2-3-10]